MWRLDFAVVAALIGIVPQGDPLTVRATVMQAGLRFYDRPPAGAV